MDEIVLTFVGLLISTLIWQNVYFLLLEMDIFDGNW